MSCVSKSIVQSLASHQQICTNSLYEPPLHHREAERVISSAGMETFYNSFSNPSVRQDGQVLPMHIGDSANGLPHNLSSHPIVKGAAPASVTRNMLQGPPVPPTHNLAVPSSLNSIDRAQPMLDGIDSPKSNALSPLAGVQTAEGKRQREREKRIMPARLQRVSNLLAGSTIEDELSGANAKQGEWDKCYFSSCKKFADFMTRFSLTH